METKCTRATVYFDESCPLCRVEIGFYRRKDLAGGLRFVKVSESDASVLAGLTRRRAVERFHVLAGNGQLLSGAAALVEVWTRRPRWRWAARGAARPGTETALEFGYRVFLPVRPFIAPLFGNMQKLGVIAGRKNRG